MAPRTRSTSPHPVHVAPGQATRLGTRLLESGNTGRGIVRGFAIERRVHVHERTTSVIQRRRSVALTTVEAQGRFLRWLSSPADARRTRQSRDRHFARAHRNWAWLRPRRGSGGHQPQNRYVVLEERRPALTPASRPAMHGYCADSRRQENAAHAASSPLSQWPTGPTYLGRCLARFWCVFGSSGLTTVQIPLHVSSAPSSPAINPKQRTDRKRPSAQPTLDGCRRRVQDRRQLLKCQHVSAFLKRETVHRVLRLPHLSYPLRPHRDLTVDELRATACSRCGLVHRQPRRRTLAVADSLLATRVMSTRFRFFPFPPLHTCRATSRHRFGPLSAQGGPRGLGGIRSSQPLICSASRPSTAWSRSCSGSAVICCDPITIACSEPGRSPSGLW